LIAAPGEKAADGNIVIQISPVYAAGAKLEFQALGGGGDKELGEPRQWRAKCTAIVQRHPHRIVIKIYVSCRNSHSAYS
jgi:hypothetical protein